MKKQQKQSEQDDCLSLGKLQEEGFLSEDPKYFGK